MTTQIATAEKTPAWRIVAEREISTTLRQKSFAITSGLMVLGVVALVVFSAVFGSKPTEYTVAVVDQDTAAVIDAASQAMDAVDEGSTVTAEVVDSRGEAESLVRDAAVDAALFASDGGYELVGDQSVDSDLALVLTAAAQSGVAVEETLLDPNADNAGERSFVAFVMVLLFYITAVTFGMTIAASVVQEKESRIVEILASAVPLRSLLWGKVLGSSALAFLQIGIVVLSAFVAMQFTDLGDIGDVIGEVSGWYVLFFVLGFFAMAGFWAIAGSLASRQQDLGSTTLPGQILLFAPYMISIVASDGVKTVVSMLPISSAMVMPARLAEGSVPLWQLLVAVAANLVAIVATVWIGARIYERTLMRTERRIGFGEALRLSD